LITENLPVAPHKRGLASGSPPIAEIGIAFLWFGKARRRQFCLAKRSVTQSALQRVGLSALSLVAAGNANELAVAMALCEVAKAGPG